MTSPERASSALRGREGRGGETQRSRKWLDEWSFVHPSRSCEPGWGQHRPEARAEAALPGFHRATPAPPAPEKALCKRNLYANVVLLLFRHPCLQGWGHLKVLSKELCRALSRAGLPSPWPGPLRGLPSHWSWCSPDWHGRRSAPQNPPPSSGTRRSGGPHPAGPQQAEENEPVAFAAPRRWRLLSIHPSS